MSDAAKIWVTSLVLGATGAYFLYYGFSAFLIEPLWLARVYKVSTDQVHVNKKPIDCDYHYAPVGYKGCQYKSVVKAYDKAGWLVGGDGVPIYSHDARTGKPIESDDNGKTWELIIALLMMFPIQR